MPKKLIIVCFFVLCFLPCTACTETQEQPEPTATLVAPTAESHQPTDTRPIPTVAPTDKPQGTDPIAIPTQEPGQVPSEILTAEPTPLPLSGAEILDSLNGLPFAEFVAESHRQLQLRDPDSLVSNGYDQLYGIGLPSRFSDLSPEYIAETQELESGLLDLLRTYDREGLSPEQQITYAAYEWYLDTLVRGHAYNGYPFLVNPVWGLQNLPLDLLSVHPLESVQDAENYIALIASLDAWADQVITGLELNEQQGAIPPRFVLESTITSIEEILHQSGTTPPNPEQSELYANFRSQIYHVEGLSSLERDSLTEAVRIEVANTFIPAYLAIKDKLGDLQSVAVEDPDQWQLPGGEEYYAYLLAYYTGTDLSADEIHALGLAEVARIQAEIKQATQEVGYPADLSMAELNQRIREDSQIITGNALLDKYEEVLSAADQAAEGFFDLQASAGVVIETDPNAPAAFYESPDPVNPGPGIMHANPSFSPINVNYNEYVLTHHETIPGHHTQHALAQELDVPYLQRYSNLNPYLQKYILQAYPEGWALYAESLAAEMGLYQGHPLENLGRLRLLLLRMVRIVVDTGIHAKGWTLDQAMQYLEETTGMPQSREGLIRYLVNPGYPSGYCIGGLKITELRQRAEAALGEAFDLKQFHNTVLGHGILPIGVLEQVVDDWIASQLNQ